MNDFNASKNYAENCLSLTGYFAPEQTKQLATDYLTYQKFFSEAAAAMESMRRTIRYFIEDCNSADHVDEWLADDYAKLGQALHAVRKW